MIRVNCSRWSGAMRVGLPLLAALLIGTKQPVSAAEPEPEYVPDVGPGSVSDPALSGDGRVMAWAYGTVDPVLVLRDLKSGAQSTLSLKSTTTDADLAFPNQVGPSLSDDGRRIALVADGPGGSRNPEIVVVLDDTGSELARVTASLGSGSVGRLFDRVFISGDGRYVTFSGEGGRFESTGVVGNGLLTFNDDFTIKTLRLDIESGALALAAFDTGGGLPNDDSSAQGISGDGRYILFCSDATDLPAANGRLQAYRGDPGNGVVLQVSLDATGTTVSGIYCDAQLFGDERLGLSDDGQRVVYTENRNTSADGDDHTFAWTEGGGSEEVLGLQKFASLAISGDGQWLAPEDEPFSRLNIDSGATEAVLFRMLDTRISDNGDVLLFANDELPKPAGQTGSWWVLRTGDEPPDAPALLLQVEEQIAVGESMQTLEGVQLAISETVSIADATSSLEGVLLNVSEQIDIAESPAALVPPPVNIIQLDINPVLLPGDTFRASATGFKPFSTVRAWLQSTPVLVGEEQADEFGNVSFEITVPQTFPPGEHTLVLQGVAPDGSDRRLEAPITVSARGAGGPGSGVGGGAVPIPVGNPWSLLLLALCLMGIVRAHWRRKSARGG